MITLNGTFFDGRTSSGTTVTLIFDTEGSCTLRREDGEQQLELATLRVTSRVGNIPRAVILPDGGRIETTDNDAVDRLLAQMGVHRGQRLVHLMESRWRFVVIALVLTLATSWISFRYGIPAGARAAAFSMPASTNTYIAKGTLEAMDEFYLKPSTLSVKTQQRLRRHFARMIKNQPEGFEYRLEFRSSKSMGANAFALPSGTIVLLDDLVRLAKNDEEIMSVLAHEIGHVYGRHAMRSILQRSFIALLVALFVGDASEAADILVLLPVFLANAQYSQDFEREADRYSLAYMMDNGIPPIRFKTMMNRMTKSHSKGDEEDDAGLWSSHPPTKERVLIFEEAQKRYEAERRKRP